MPWWTAAFGVMWWAGVAWVEAIEEDGQPLGDVIGQGTSYLLGLLTNVRADWCMVCMRRCHQQPIPEWTSPTTSDQVQTWLDSHGAYTGSDCPSLCTAGYRDTAASTIRGWMKRLRVGEPVVLGLDAFDHALALIAAAGTAAQWNCYPTDRRVPKNPRIPPDRRPQAILSSSEQSRTRRWRIRFPRQPVGAGTTRSSMLAPVAATWPPSSRDNYKREEEDTKQQLLIQEGVRPLPPSTACWTFWSFVWRVRLRSRRPLFLSLNFHSLFFSLALTLLVDPQDQERVKRQCPPRKDPRRAAVGRPLLPPPEGGGGGGGLLFLHLPSEAAAAAIHPSGAAPGVGVGGGGGGGGAGAGVIPGAGVMAVP